MSYTPETIEEINTLLSLLNKYAGVYHQWIIDHDGDWQHTSLELADKKLGEFHHFYQFLKAIRDDKLIEFKTETQLWKEYIREAIKKRDQNEGTQEAE